ncbi:MAG: hypothetical protein WC291_02265, partial [Thermodesulfovibrionales bacterium]|jgi:hypothetical protein
MYEVALNFYFQLLPHSDEAVAAKKDPALTAKWEKFKGDILNRTEHKWVKGLPPEELRTIVDFYKKRYGKEGGQ